MAVFRQNVHSVERARDSKNVCYKVSLCENCQRQSCKAFTGLSIREKYSSWWMPSST